MRHAATSMTAGEQCEFAGPGTQRASDAPSHAPAMPGTPNQSTLRQSTCFAIA